MADGQNPTDGGFVGGLENILSNPLLQGAASAYLNYLGTPRYMRRGGALMNAGLGGLSAFNQAEMQKRQIPMLEAQLQQEQAKVPLMQAETAQQQLATQQLKRQMQPLPTQLQQAIDTYKSTATDPQEKGFIDVLEQQAKAGLITPEELGKSLESYDQSKRMMELYKGQAAQMQASYMPQFMQMFGFPAPAAPTTQMPVGGMSASGTAPETGGGAPSLPPDLGFTPDYHTTNPAGDVAYHNSADGKWYAKDPSGKWQPIS